LLATYLVLLRSPLLSEKDAEQYHNAFQEKGAKDLFISEEIFVNTPAWFDETEFSIDRHYSIPYPRVRLIKELLFKIHREERHGQVQVNGKKLISFFKAKEFTLFKRTMKCYEEILFAKIEK